MVAARGIAPHRFVMAGYADSAEHRERIALIDLLLDSTAYTMHSTGAEGVWAATPIVSMPGPGFAARVGYSMNAAAVTPAWDQVHRCGGVVQGATTPR